MFTGIIEERGEVRRIDRAAGKIHIAARTIIDDLAVGDSVAVNGVCLTVVSFDAGGFVADVMPETWRVTTLGDLKIGAGVNLERALKADGRFGGHIVVGHIDGVGRIAEIKKDGNARWLTVAAAPEILRYVIYKGSIAIDGTSLTVAAVGAGDFSVSLIPLTQDFTTLAEKKRGDSVNLETDIVGRYIEHFLNIGKTAAPAAPKLTAAFLAENGF